MHPRLHLLPHLYSMQRVVHAVCAVLACMDALQRVQVQGEVEAGVRADGASAPEFHDSFPWPNLLDVTPFQYLVATQWGDITIDSAQASAVLSATSRWPW